MTKNIEKFIFCKIYYYLILMLQSMGGDILFNCIVHIYIHTHTYCPSSKMAKTHAEKDLFLLELVSNFSLHSFRLVLEHWEYEYFPLRKF